MSISTLSTTNMLQSLNTNNSTIDRNTQLLKLIEFLVFNFIG